MAIEFDDPPDPSPAAADQTAILTDPVGSAPSLGEPVEGDELLKARLLAGTGARVGRFTVLRHIDQGGMGLIFAARDEQLNRPVALKILRSRAANPQGRARLFREAQALARLSHPNVVTVYEVGDFEGHVFLAMEMVEGQTLRAWQKKKRRSWREIVAVYVQAGRGLAAAHAAGIVHRDFKPANVLVGADGRVRVLDFGIARAITPDEEGDADDPGRREALTVDGMVIGTPAYMAPEQLQAGEVDARADQYAFCVALAEALSGKRPVKGKTLDERLRELDQRPIPELPRDARIPAFLRAALLRGLDPDPARRFPSMAALLAAIDRDPGRTRLLIAGGVALGVVLLIAGFFLARRELGGACDDVGGELAGVWDDSRREVLHAAFTATGLAYAGTASERFAANLDAYADAWRESRRGACVAHQRGEHAAALYGLQVACLQRRRGALKALVDTLVSADAKAVEKAIGAAGDLPSVAPCTDVAALTAAVAPPEDPRVAAEVGLLREQLEPARVALSLHKGDDGLAIAAPILARARELGYVPLEAEAAGVVGNLQALGTDLDAAEQTLVDAVWLADQIRDDELLAEHMASLIGFVGDRRGRHEDALRWRRHADTVRARLPADGRGQARLLRAIAGALFRQTRHDEAFALYERALAIGEGLYGPNDLRLRDSLMGLGNVAMGKGDLAAARGYYQRALTLQEAAFGPDHPMLGSLLANLGAAVAMAGEFDAALAHMQRALLIQEAAYGKDHPELASTLGNIGALLATKGDETGARPYMERSLALDEALHGPDHPSIVTSLINLATLVNALGDTAACRAHAERAVASGEKVLARDDPQLAGALFIAGYCDLRVGKARAALPRLERALAIREARADVIDPGELAQGRYRLALALRALSRDPARQQELATRALAGLRAADPASHADLIAEIEGWLAAAPPPAAASKGKKKKTKAKKKKKK